MNGGFQKNKTTTSDSDRKPQKCQVGCREFLYQNNYSTELTCVVAKIVTLINVKLPNLDKK